MKPGHSELTKLYVTTQWNGDCATFSHKLRPAVVSTHQLSSNYII